jgi:dihydroorotase
VTEESVGGLDSLEDFVAKRGASFYGLPPAASTRLLVRESWKVPDHYPFGDQCLACIPI